MHPALGSAPPISGCRQGQAGGSRRVFGQFSCLRLGSGKVAFPRPAHQRVSPKYGDETHTIGAHRVMNQQYLTMSDYIQRRIEQIKKVFPYDVGTVQIHENGDDFVVIEINQEWMFRSAAEAPAGWAAPITM